MSMNFYVKSLLMDELRWRTNLSDDTISSITESFLQKVKARRHTIVPTYLTDDMYESAKSVNPAMDFSMANDIYRAAITEYERHDPSPVSEDVQPTFW